MCMNEPAYVVRYSLYVYVDMNVCVYRRWTCWVCVFIYICVMTDCVLVNVCVGGR